jgi:hypothetical protein
MVLLLLLLLSSQLADVANGFMSALWATWDL